MLPVTSKALEDQADERNVSHHEDSGPTTPRLSSSNSTQPDKQEDQSDNDEASDQNEDISEAEASSDSEGDDTPPSPEFGK